MHVQDSAERRLFDLGTRLMHWLTAGLMLWVFVLAFSVDLATSRAAHTAVLQLHRSIGLTVWLVVLVRLAWRQIAKYPEWPSGMSKNMRSLAKASEYGLYVLLLLQPVLGLLQTNAHGDHVNMFFVGSLPASSKKVDRSRTCC